MTQVPHQVHRTVTAVIFDLDGLLADTEPFHRQAYQEALKPWGVELSESVYSEHWIRNGGGIVDFIRDRRLSLDPDLIRAAKARHYDKRVRAAAQPMPGAREALAALAGRKALALATSSYREAADAVIDTLRIRTYFRVIVTQADTSRVKPHPDLFLLAAERLKKDPSECVVVEDAEKGIRAANTAGMRSIAIPTPYTRNNDFSRASMILQSLHELTAERLDSMERT